MSAMRSKLAAMKQVFKEQLICQLLISTPSQLTELDVERQLKNCHWDFEIELAMNIAGVVEVVETPEAEQRGSEETVWACICHIAVNLRAGSPFVRLITIPTIHSPSFQRHRLCRATGKSWNGACCLINAERWGRLQPRTGATCVRKRNTRAEQREGLSPRGTATPVSASLQAFRAQAATSRDCRSRPPKVL